MFHKVAPLLSLREVKIVHICIPTGATKSDTEARPIDWPLICMEFFNGLADLQTCPLPPLVYCSLTCPFPPILNSLRWSLPLTFVTHNANVSLWESCSPIVSVTVSLVTLLTVLSHDHALILNLRFRRVLKISFSSSEGTGKNGVGETRKAFLSEREC